MSVDLTAETTGRPEPKRGRWGWYKIPDDDGVEKLYPRVTTIVKTLPDSERLMKWQNRMVAKGVASDEGLTALAASHDPELDRKTFDQLVDDAKTLAGTGKKANIGSGVHKSIQQWAEGVPLAHIFAAHHPHVAAFEALLDEHGLEVDPGGQELVIYSDKMHYAGQVDYLPLVRKSDGRKLVGDLKTGKRYDDSWLQWAQQLAAYAHHDGTFDTITEQRGPRVDVDLEVGVLVHIPSAAPDDAVLFPRVDLERGHAALLQSLVVRDLRKAAKAWHTAPDGVGEGLVDEATTLTHRQWIEARVEAIQAQGGKPAVAMLVAMWPENTPKPLPAELAPPQIEALKTVLSKVERQFEVGFPPAEPGTVPDLEVVDGKVVSVEADA